ncbi:hypothetical protein BKI52_43035 [marine bacterium AO1-C]|nr:hypothetical protein BKI52_43035 [marine bacterium AO1-C]
MKSRALLVFLIVVCSLAKGLSQAPKFDNTSAQKIDALVKPLDSKKLFSGVILIAQDSKVVYQKSFGFANWEHQIPNTTNTKFGIGSLTKVLTGIVVEQLIKEKKLNLDDLIEKYIVGFPKSKKERAPTIKHLYNHRAGIAHRVTTPQEETRFLSTTDIVNKIKAQGLLFKPGSRRLYSSAGYTVLARIIEIIEQKPFAKVLQERVFKPAKMTNASDTPQRPLLPNRASGYFLGTHLNQLSVVNAPLKDLSFLVGAGSVFATAEDLFHLLEALKQSSLNTPIWKNTQKRNPQQWQGWTGRTNGYEAYMDVLPAKGYSLIILTNLRSVATWQVRKQIRLLLNQQAMTQVLLPPPVKSSSIDHEKIIGQYKNNRGAIIRINNQNGKLFRQESEFYPIDNQTYYIPISGTKMKFRFNKKGKADAIIQIRSNGEVVLPRVN